METPSDKGGYHFRLITGSLNCVTLSSPLTVKKEKKKFFFAKEKQDSPN